MRSSRGCGWHSRGYLPHFDMPGLVQFINYRLDDAMPASLRHEWAALLEIDDEQKRRAKIEEYLDRGRGRRRLAGMSAAFSHADARRPRGLASGTIPARLRVARSELDAHLSVPGAGR